MVANTRNPYGSNGSTPRNQKINLNSTVKDRRHTIHYDELASWRKDNHDIQTGYRRELPSYRLIVHSLFAYWHNETINIWTHLVGACIALIAAFTLSGRNYFDLTTSPSTGRLGWSAPFHLIYPFTTVDQPSVDWVDTLVVAIFLSSAAACLSFSSSFHALSAHSEEVSKRFHRLDYIGIALLISGTFVPCVHFGFYCDVHLKHFYLALITLATSATIYITLSPHASTPAYRRFRTAVFVSLGASAIFPIFHGIHVYGFDSANDLFSLIYLAGGGALYIVGAVLYAERCPERLRPGKFDLFGASHQIFHVMILLAALAHYGAIAESFRFRHGELNGVCP